MKKLIEDFAGQIEEGIEIFNANPPKAIHGKAQSAFYANVVISGLGGSGIGGTIIKDMSSAVAYCPVLVNKEYSIPAFVGANTLFIASSYSGDTEETISATEIALERKATIICITSGGKLQQIAKEKNIDYIIIPGGNPPRACLGYSLTQLVSIFSCMGLLPKEYQKYLAEAAKFIRQEESTIVEKAKSVAQQIFHKKVVIYCDSSHEGTAIRFRQQLNENAKTLCWHHVVPEMNHNELVGWTEKAEDHAVIFLRTSTDHPRNQHRIEINKSIVSDYGPTMIEIWSEGTNEIEKTFYLIHLVDWISYFLAELKGVDIMDIKVIDFLKNKLSEID